MEYLPEGDLAHYLKNGQSLPELEAQQITFQLLEALSLMHENGFAHRDLKPQVRRYIHPSQPYIALYYRVYNHACICIISTLVDCFFASMPSTRMS